MKSSPCRGGPGWPKSPRKLSETPPGKDLRQDGAVNDELVAEGLIIKVGASQARNEERLEDAGEVR